MIRRLVERAVAVEAGELGPALLSALYFFCLLFGYYTLRPLRDAMGLAGGVASLRVLFLVTLGVMILANLVFAAVASRLPRRVFVPLVYGFGVLCLIGFLGVFIAQADTKSVQVGRVFYVWLSVFNLFATMVFWGFMADIFTRGQGTRLFGFIGVGGTAGAICGSAWTGLLTERIGTVGLFACAAGLFALAGGIAVALDRMASRRGMHGGGPEQPAGPLGGTSWQGLVDTVRNPYLLAIAGTVGLFTIVSTLLYFEKARIIEAYTGDPQARAVAFAWIDFGGQTLTVLLQVFLTGRLMRRLGLGALLAVVPVVTIAGFLLLAAAPAVLIVGAFDAVRRSAHFALSKPAREALFTLVPRVDKYKAKGVIDTFVYRGGDTVGTLADMAIAAAGLVAAWLAVPLGAGSLVLAVCLGRRASSIASEQEGSRETRGLDAPVPIAPEPV